MHRRIYDYLYSSHFYIPRIPPFELINDYISGLKRRDIYYIKQLLEAYMARITKEDKKLQRVRWIRQNILQINIINIIGAYFSPTQEGFVGIVLLIFGCITILNAFNKELNITFINKGYAVICFCVGAFTTYIGGMLIYVTIFSWHLPNNRGEIIALLASIYVYREICSHTVSLIFEFLSARYLFFPLFKIQTVF